MKKYLINMNMDINKMPRVMTRDVFVFGTTKFPTLGKIVIPLKYRDVEGACWGAWLGTENLEMRIRGDTAGKEHTIEGFNPYHTIL